MDHFWTVGQIHLFALARQKAAGLVHILVSDHGAGMTEKQLKDLFKPFYTSKKSGTGLGLVLVKKMLSKMNCDIKVTSVLHKGTTIEISILDGNTWGTLF